MTNQEFDAMRREAEITSAQIANYAGATVKELLMVETGKAPVKPWMIRALKFLIKNS